ncbi:hypothetical protein LOK49_Contig5G00004 [Camellia lanceoleosa]|nr:hypothetical protein LOK49_Contig5G00004 [Camellia lanceoleosa]
MDIDLTALSSPTVEETLARDVLAVLQGEGQNENAEYEVKDIQFIDVEMKQFTAKIVDMMKQENSMHPKADPLSYPRN